MLNPQLSQHIDDFYASSEGAAAVLKDENKNQEEDDNKNAFPSRTTITSWRRSKSWWLGVDFSYSVAGSLLLVVLAAASKVDVVKHQQSLLSLAVGLAVGAAFGGLVVLTWTNRSSSSSSSTGMNGTLRGLLRKKFYNKRMIRERKEWSEQISMLLGSVGAPLLNPSIELSSDCNLSKNQLDFLLEFVQSQVTLLLQVHETINLLRRATSLLFGVDSTSRNVSIERIEKAALGRWSNHVKQGSSIRIVLAGRMPVSLPTLRKRVNEILQQQIESLLAISVETCTHHDYQRESDIITLSLLVSKKAQAVELLATIVGKTRSHVDEDTFNVMKLCLKLAKRSCSYLSAAAQSAFPSSNSESDKQSSSEQSIIHLLDQLESLRIALLACHDNNTSVEQQQGVAADSSVLASDWEKFEKFAQSFGEAVEQTSRQRQRAGSLEDISRENSDGDDERDILLAGLQEDDVSYSGEAVEQSPGVNSKKPNDSESQRKTLVFSGVAAQRMRKPRKRSAKTSLNTNPNASLPPQFQLVNELNQRLRALPPSEELNVRKDLDHHDDDDDDDDGSGVLDNTTTAVAASDNPDGHCDSGGSVPTLNTSAFLGELKDLVANSINKEDNLQWDNNWERYPS